MILVVKLGDVAATQTTPAIANHFKISLVISDFGFLK